MKTRTHFRPSGWLGALALATLTQSASAHIEVTAPEPREPGNDSIKQGPCGSDDWGDGTVHERAPGDVVTVTWTETIHHAGYFRVVLSMSGDAALSPPTEASYDAYSNDSPPDPVMGPVTEGDVLVYYDYYEPHTAQDTGSERTVEITLPQATCEQCTLQVIQMMADGQPYSGAYYYSCADLTIAGEVSAGGAGAGGGSAVGGASAVGGTDMGGSAGASLIGMGGGGGNGLVAPSAGMGGQAPMGTAGMPMLPMMGGAAGQTAPAAGAPPLIMMGGLGGTPAGNAGTTGAPIAAGGAPTAQAGAAGMMATGTAPAAACSTSGGTSTGPRGLGLFVLALIGAGATWGRRRSPC